MRNEVGELKEANKIHEENNCTLDLMEKAGKLTDLQSPDCFKEFKEMWKTLKQPFPFSPTKTI